MGIDVAKNNLVSYPPVPLAIHHSLIIEHLGPSQLPWRTVEGALNVWLLFWCAITGGLGASISMKTCFVLSHLLSLYCLTPFLFQSACCSFSFLCLVSVSLPFHYFNLSESISPPLCFSPPSHLWFHSCRGDTFPPLIMANKTLAGFSF